MSYARGLTGAGLVETGLCVGVKLPLLELMDNEWRCKTSGAVQTLRGAWRAR